MRPIPKLSELEKFSDWVPPRGNAIATKRVGRIKRRLEHEAEKMADEPAETSEPIDDREEEALAEARAQIAEEREERGE